MNYDNQLDSDVWLRTAMTKSGAYSLAKTYQTKFKATVLEKPFLSEDGFWVFLISNPLKSMRGEYDEE
jgi:hypothetical protein